MEYVLIISEVIIKVFQFMANVFNIKKIVYRQYL